MYYYHDVRLYTTNYNDEAVVNLSGSGDRPSFHKGRVRLISERGINISTDYGDHFVKWQNVKQVIKKQEGANK
jgi:hypothetical protein